MSLVPDAVNNTSELLNKVVRFSKDRFKADVLQHIIDANNLDETEIVSIIFLFTDKNTDIASVITFLENTSPITLDILKYQSNWEEKFLECLLIIGNVNVIKKLGFKNDEITAMKERFLYKEHNISVNLNRVIKSLYFVCENLTKYETEKLITEVNIKLLTAIKHDKKQLLLELYILHWLQLNYISINEDYPHLTNIIQDLKNIGCLMPFNFEDWCSNKQDPSTSLILKNDNSMQYTNKFLYNQNENQLNKIRIPWKGRNKQLCIIVNQINFKDKTKYETRLASDLDEKNLRKTFKGCNFEVNTHRDLTRCQMIEFLDSFNVESYHEYSCIFLCILSHGSEGEVVFSDGKKIKIEKIKDKFCCQKLQNVFKFIVLQSCQGVQKGFVDTKLLSNQKQLVTDGPSIDQPLCPLFFEHFVLFQATINGFGAYRDTTKGTWFIQDICEELKISTPIKVTEWIQNVIRRVSNRRYTFTNDSNKDAVQMPQCTNTISVDYEIPGYQEKNC